MTAENILPIINALPDSEKERLYLMLGVCEIQVGQNRNKEKSLISDGEATEYLVKMFQKRWKKNRQNKDHG